MTDLIEIGEDNRLAERINFNCEGYPAVKKILARMVGYKWCNSKTRDAARVEVEAIGHSILNDFEKQVEIHVEKLSDIYCRDYSEKTVAMAKQNRANARQFLTLNELKEYRPIKVDISGRKEWLLWNVDVSDKPISTKALKILTVLKQNGFEFDEYYIAEKRVKPQQHPVSLGGYLATTPQALKDPLLIVRKGRYLVQIDRWE